MKTFVEKLLVVIGIVFVVATSSSVASQIASTAITSPSVATEMWSSAGRMNPVKPGTVRPQAVGNGPAVIRLTPVLMASPNSFSSPAAQDQLIADARAGILKTHTDVMGPTDYGRVYYWLWWSNMVYSVTNTGQWNGVLFHAPPQSGEKGLVLTILADIISVSGGDDISLSSIIMTNRSVDGLLNGAFNFVGLNYTKQAPLIKADGTVVTSGSTSQKGRRCLVILFPKLFNVGGTQNGLNQVEGWVNGRWPYRMDYSVFVNGDEVRTMSTLVLNSPTGDPIIPVLSLLRNGRLFIANGEPQRTYEIQSRQKVDDGPWAFESIVTETNWVPIQFPGESRFYRAFVQ